MQLYLDMDGVLADFDTGYEQVFGVRPNKLTDDVVWDKIREHKDFYLNLPLMTDALELWEYCAQHKPIILTGVPASASVPEAPGNKEAWVLKHFGLKAEIRCVRSREKFLHAKPGDVLVDDWTKYKHLWERAGGIWITHTSAVDTINQLRAHGL